MEENLCVNNLINFSTQTMNSLYFFLRYNHKLKFISTNIVSGLFMFDEEWEGGSYIFGVEVEPTR